jgi:hypothetical protein
MLTLMMPASLFARFYDEVLRLWCLHLYPHRR